MQSIFSGRWFEYTFENAQWRNNVEADNFMRSKEKNKQISKDLNAYIYIQNNRLSVCMCFHVHPQSERTIFFFSSEIRFIVALFADLSISLNKMKKILLILVFWVQRLATDANWCHIGLGCGDYGPWIKDPLLRYLRYLGEKVEDSSGIDSDLHMYELKSVFQS